MKGGTVTKTATVNLHGNLYEVDPALAGSKVGRAFDPFDLTDITVRHHGRPAGKATPFKIGRHVHPKAAAYAPPPPVTPTGVDYLRLLEDRQTRALGERLRYAQLGDPTHATESTGPTIAPSEQQPPTDHDGLRYDSDLLALAALDQRIALRYTLPGMTHTETRDYLSHHLKLVGRSDQLFSDDAADLIHQTSRGLPNAP